MTVFVKKIDFSSNELNFSLVSLHIFLDKIIELGAKGYVTVSFSFFKKYFNSTSLNKKFNKKYIIEKKINFTLPFSEYIDGYRDSHSSLSFDSLVIYLDIVEYSDDLINYLNFIKSIDFV